MRLGVLVLVLGVGGCEITPMQPRPPTGHVSTESVPKPAADIPPPLRVAPVLPPPKPAPPSETYTVVVNDVPVKELLFALSRDAKMNVDISPDITGQVTLNAVNQTLNQILERISRQIDLRYRVMDGTIVISPDKPFLRSYRVDYVNMSRDATGSVTVATQIETTGKAASGATGGGGGAGGGNNSTTSLSTTSNNRFWYTLTKNVQSILASTTPGTTNAAATDREVIANPEAGVLTVRATARQHKIIRAYLDEVLANARREVLVEVTVVEVELNDEYQGGIDWTKLAAVGGFSLQQSFLAGNLAAAPFFLLQYASRRTGAPGPTGNEASNVSTANAQGISATVRLLKTFGDTRVLSSPKLMVLNNQTALLKVVNNIVYFEVTAQPATTTVAGASGEPAITTTARTVPVGLVMAVTPQISSADEVILNVRPTISRLDKFVPDPQPDLAKAGQVNNVPQISVREMESMLRVHSGQIAVLGGLMQDQTTRTTNAIPFVSEVPKLGELFKARDNNYTKTELVIFLRPWVVRTPSVTADLRSFEQYLPENLKTAEPLPQTAPLKQP